MGKYTQIGFVMSYKESPSEYERAKYEAIIDIANELAEANRLKRLEMRHNLGMITSRKEMKEELEDKA